MDVINSKEHEKMMNFEQLEANLRNEIKHLNMQVNGLYETIDRNNQGRNESTKAID